MSTASTRALRDEKAREILSSRSAVTPWVERRTMNFRPWSMGRMFLPLRATLSSKRRVLDGEGPCDNVVKPPAAVLEVVLKAVNVSFVDRATDLRVRSVEDWNGDG